ncbi:MAG: glucose-6-phosphate dehydrogenase assembly protein OpcA [Chloroflexi bacterium]|nr:glucose-6-phosphate dehydrogenase assembly protein OpcA [Chloroflexota bacterium]
MTQENTLIPLAQVEKLLREKWLVTGVPGAARACTLNLVVVLAHVDERPAVQDLLAQTIQRYPNRALIIVPDNDTPEPGMAASVRVSCPGAAAHLYCCEQITIHVREDVWRHAHSAVLPLLLPELPVNIWWHRALDLEDPLFERLQTLADGLLVDAAAQEDPVSTIRALGQVYDRFLWGAMDLSWARLTPWRELIAQAFDPMERRPYLWGIEHVTVSATPTPAGTAAALYLVGWLAGRLGWTPQSTWRTRGRTRELHFTRGETPILVTVTRSRHDYPTPLVRVRLAARSTTTARFTIEVGEEPDLVHITTDVGSVHVRQTVRTRWPEQAHALGEALRINGQDRIFREALDIVLSLLPSSNS